MLVQTMRRRGVSRRCVAVASGLIALMVNHPVAAQVHADASIEVGVMKRFLTGRAPGEADAGFGPAAQIAAHIALVPLVRVGAYLGHDISPRAGASARNITWGGARVKVMSPWTNRLFRVWVFAGFGIAGVYAQGVSGGFSEVPFGIGASYKLRKPWELCAELGARVGFVHHGRVYEAPGLSIPDSASGHAAPAGSDVFALVLTVGVLFDL